MPVVSAKQVIIELTQHGFYELDHRTRGSHHRYTDGKGHYVTIAYHHLKDIIPPYASKKRQITNERIIK